MCVNIFSKHTNASQNTVTLSSFNKRKFLLLFPIFCLLLAVSFTLHSLTGESALFLEHYVRENLAKATLETHADAQVLELIHTHTHTLIISIKRGISLAVQHRVRLIRRFKGQEDQHLYFMLMENS